MLLDYSTYFAPVIEVGGAHDPILVVTGMVAKPLTRGSGGFPATSEIPPHVNRFKLDKQIL